MDKKTLQDISQNIFFYVPKIKSNTESMNMVKSLDWLIWLIDWFINNLFMYVSDTYIFNLCLFMYAHQDCIFVIKNMLKTVIL